jgi:hypothetical protein
MEEDAIDIVKDEHAPPGHGIIIHRFPSVTFFLQYTFQS